MASLCARCGVRAAPALCEVCAAAGVAEWHASDARTWLPRATACALGATLLSITLLALIVVAVRLKPLQSLPLTALWRLAAQLWWMALGAPVSVSVSAPDSANALATLRFSSMLGVLPATLLLVVAGAMLTRWLRAAAEIEHLIGGALVALPTAVLGAALAAVVPFTARSLDLGDTTLDVRLAASPLHAAAVSLLWGMVCGTLGGLARYAWTTRGRHWEALQRGPWPAVAGGVAGLLAGIVLASCGSLLQLRGLPAIDAEGGDTVHRSLALYARAGAVVGLVTAATAFDAGVGVAGQIVVGGPETDGPSDSSVTLRLLDGVTVLDPLGRLQAPLWRASWVCILVPLLAAIVGGRVSRGLDPRSATISLGLRHAVVFALGGLTLAAWTGGWVSGSLTTEGATPPVPTLWAVWQASLFGSLLFFFAWGLLGGTIGALLRPRAT